MNFEKILDEMIKKNMAKHRKRINREVKRTLIYGSSLPLRAYKKTKPSPGGSR